MWWWLVLPCAAMTADEAIEAALARAPALELAEARIEEARGRVREAVGRALPQAAVAGNVVAQTPIDVDITQSLPVPIPGDATVDPLVVVPGQQLQATADVTVPVVLPAAWAAHRAARRGVDLAHTQADVEREALTRRVLEAFYAAAEARAVLGDARRAEALAARLLEKGQTLVELGAAAEDQILPFERAHATARANVARAREGVTAADGVLQMLTGKAEGAELSPVPTEAPSLAEVLQRIDRADLRAASQAIDAASAQIGVARAERLPSVAVQAGVVAVDPAPDLGRDLTWRVALGARVPLFQGGAVQSRVRQAKARRAQAEAGARTLQEAAELEVRRAHGALSQALSSLVEQEAAEALANRAVQAAERRVDEGGGSLLQLQQAQLEEVRAQVALTRARTAASRAMDALAVAVRGALSL